LDWCVTNFFYITLHRVFWAFHITVDDDDDDDDGRSRLQQWNDLKIATLRHIISFYRAMLCRARLCYSMSSVRPSACLSVTFRYS